MNSVSEKNKKALLLALFKRTKNKINFLNKKRLLLIGKLTKESDSNKIKKIREDILK